MSNIISSFGAKGGTGKSSILFSIIKYLYGKKYNQISFNCDSSSVTMPVLIKAASLKLNVLNIDDYYITSFLEANKLFFSAYDYITIDLKGEELRNEDLVNLFKITKYFIMPIVPSTSGISAAIGLLDKAKNLNCEMKKIIVVFNLLGYTEKSNHYLSVKETINQYSKDIGIICLETPISTVSNMEDKEGSSILNSKKNYIVVEEIVNNYLTK